MSDTFGYPSCLPCEICGRHINNQAEPRFYYVVCEEHQAVAPNMISAEKEKWNMANFKKSSDTK